ncbi:MAG: UDP-N-acetylmuramate--L-alanine ligase [Acidimicrobiia bacterium]|nr:UDP-N-acetylmuramate--L-alanine ligase [Acidimicrobiia bacterium]
MVDFGSTLKIHVVGAGGVGMSGLAKLLSQMGHSLTGSDLKMSPTLASLADLGMEVWSGSRPAAMLGLDLVVASSAIPATDPEVVAAREYGIDVWERPRLLTELTARLPTIGATGTHGKTTSTAMLIAALRATGLDPSFVVGGEVTDLRANASLGEDDLLVLEVDEAFGTFLDLSIKGLMVTNVEPDHLDYYHSVDRLEDAFVEVVRSVDGPVVVGVDDPGGRRLAERTSKTTYGTSADADWRMIDVTQGQASIGFRLVGSGRTHRVTVARPGLHIARDAGGVLALLGELGYDLEAAVDGLRSFTGVRRRFEVRGRVAGITIIDDYAHHPTEIAATLQAVRQGSWKRVWAVFQPHRYSRTLELYQEFGGAFTGADHVVVTDVYAAGETPEPGVTGALVADAVTAQTEADVHFVQHRADLADYLADRLEPGDLVLTLGAGDITTLAGELAPLLEKRRV